MTQRWNVSLRGHSAVVSITPDVPAHTFEGEIVSTEYGKAPVTDCKIDGGGHYIGHVTLNGTNAKIDAVVNGDGNLVGTVHIGWFITVNFTGTPLHEV